MPHDRISASIAVDFSSSVIPLRMCGAISSTRKGGGYVGLLYSILTLEMGCKCCDTPHPGSLGDRAHTRSYDHSNTHFSSTRSGDRLRLRYSLLQQCGSRRPMVLLFLCRTFSVSADYIAPGRCSVIACARAWSSRTGWSVSRVNAPNQYPYLLTSILIFYLGIFSPLSWVLDSVYRK